MLLPRRTLGIVSCLLLLASGCGRQKPPAVPEVVEQSSGSVEKDTLPHLVENDLRSSRFLVPQVAVTIVSTPLSRMPTAYWQLLQ
jgi:hypothetical protein